MILSTKCYVISNRKNHTQHTKVNAWPQLELWAPLILTKHREFQMQKNNALEDILLLGLTGDVSINLLKVRHSLFQFLWGVSLQREKPP